MRRVGDWKKAILLTANMGDRFRKTVRRSWSAAMLLEHIAAELMRAHGGEIRLVPGTIGATFSIAIPDRAVDLNSRRGRIQTMDTCAVGQSVRALVPLAEMFGYVTSLRSITQGRAASSMEFDHYAEVPNNVALAVITEATLSFLGSGMPDTQPSLGTLIRIGNRYLFSGDWWIVAFPGIALAGLILSINLLGDWLRDALNPKLR